MNERHKKVLDWKDKDKKTFREIGELMDGRHRLMKAMLLGHEKIKAVRFDENPSPCRVSDA